MMFPKNSRIVDKTAIERVRTYAMGVCEICGGTVCGNYDLEVHHIKSKGSGGHDIEENLIVAGCICHGLAQEYKISRDKLFKIAIARAQEIRTMYKGLPVKRLKQLQRGAG